MAKTTIHSLRYEVLADTSGFQKGMKATRKALNAAKRTIKETAAPMDRFQADLARIQKLQRMGLITMDTYNRKLRQLKSQYGQTSRAARLFGKSMSAAQASIATAVAGISFGTIARNIGKAVDRMDSLAKSARALGTSTEFLSGLEFVAQRTSGLDPGRATVAITKMTQRIAKGSSEAENALNKLGIQIDSLRGKSPEEIFRQVQVAMADMEDAGQRSAIAVALFDDEQAKLHTTMALTNDEYQEQIRLAESLNQVVSQEQSKAAEQAADDLQEATAAWSGFWNSQVVWSGKALSAWTDYTRAIKQSGVIGHFSAAAGMPNQDFRQGMLGRREMRLVTDPNERAYLNAIRDMEEREKRFREKQVRLAQQKEEQKTRDTYARFYSGVGSKFISEMAVAGEMGLLPDFTNRAAPPAAPAARFRNIVSSSDPASSIAARSSEAFRIANRTESSREVEIEAAKTTADSTAKTAELVGVLVEQNANAVPVGL